MSLSLAEVINYQNDRVIDHFRKRWPEYSLETSQQLFKDLMAWMWLNQQRTLLGKKTYLFGPLLILDEMWHSFILHTRDYSHFSIQYFGEYFHHEVEPSGMEHELEEEELRDFLDDCCRLLGEEWIDRQFAEAFV